MQKNYKIDQTGSKEYRIRLIWRHIFLEDMLKVELRGLKIRFFLGVYPHEQEAMQEVIFDISLACKTPELQAKNDLSRFLNYDILVRALCTNFEGKRYALIEDVIFGVREILRGFEPVTSAEIRVTKLGTHANLAGVCVAYNFHEM